MRLIPFAFKDARLWGFNHLIFLPDIFTAMFILIGVIALALPLFPFSEAAGGTISDKFSHVFFKSTGRYLYRLLVIVLMAGLFAIFAMPTHFLGDGYASLANLGSETGTFYKWSEKGITFIVSTIQSFIGPKNVQTARTSFQIISITSGIVSIWFFFLISGLISEDQIKRVMTFSISLLSATLLLFFGYVESYPLLWISLTGFIYFSLRYLRKKRGLFWPLLFLALGVFIHLQMLVLIPAFLYLTHRSDFGQSIYLRYKRLMRVIGGFVLIGGIAIFIHRYTSDLYFENIFLPPFTGKPVDPRYALISAPHLVDIINLLMLLSPLLFLLLFLSRAGLKKFTAEKSSIFLIVLSLSNLLFLLVIDAKLGMPRDWDLLSLSVYAFTLLLIISVQDDHVSLLKKLLPSMLIMLVLFSAPYLLTNLTEQRSLRYYKYFIDLDRKGSLSGLVVLREYYRDHGDTRRKDSINTLIEAKFTDELNINRAFSALRNHNLPQARSILETMTPDKFSSDYHNLLSMIYFAEGNNDKALEEAKKAVQLQRYKPALLRNLARIYAHRGEYDKAFEPLRRAYELHSNNFYVVEGLANLHLEVGNLDSAIYYSERLMATGGGEATSYYLLCKIHALKGMADGAEKYLDLYLKKRSSDPLFSSRYPELLKLTEGIEKNQNNQ